MNRRDRRAARKLSRHAAPEEIFPGEHGPIQTGIGETMTAALRAIRRSLGPGYEITLFVAEASPPLGERRLPRFNYASTANRDDMIAVLEAFVLKHRSAAPKLDRFDDPPPSSTPQ
jgi:hypothetical protein